MLFTGAEPVVIFPDAEPSKGCASGKFLTSGEKPVEFWQQPDELWARWRHAWRPSLASLWPSIRTRPS